MESYKEFEKVMQLIPKDACAIHWDEWKNTLLFSVFEQMERTYQNPEHHGEIDVFSHTKMVCEEMIKQPEYQNGSARDKTVLFLAALLHDIGKISCTIERDGEIKSPNHSICGDTMVRKLLWKDFGLCGDYEKQQMREAICCLIRHHSFPPYALSKNNPALRLHKIASNGELANGFTIEKLCALERADMLGRINKDTDKLLEKVECFRLLAEEENCLKGPFVFANDFSKRAYFKGKTLWKEHDLFNDTWGEVIMLSGLPGTGKDTWIRKNASNIPIVSLDDIRRKLKISPKDNQHRVVAEGYESAKAYLRKKQPFVWNATNITAQTRDKIISLFEEYGASVKTVFLETSWDQQLLRNGSREAVVPESVICKMLSKLTLPERYESETVLWQNV